MMRKKVFKILILLFGLQLGGLIATAPVFAAPNNQSSSVSSYVVTESERDKAATDQGETSQKKTSSVPVPSKSNKASSSKKNKQLKPKKQQAAATKAATDGDVLTWGSINNSLGPFNYGTFGSYFMNKAVPDSLSGVQLLSTIVDNYNFGTSDNLGLTTLYGDTITDSGVLTTNIPPLPLANSDKYDQRKWQQDINWSSVSNLSFSTSGSGSGLTIKRGADISIPAAELQEEMDFHLELTMTPTIFHTVKVRWQATNQTGKSVDVFFLRMLDTALNSNPGSNDYSDNVPIYFLGNSQGLFIKDSTGIN